MIDDILSAALTIGALLIALIALLTLAVGAAVAWRLLWWVLA
jgi:hypothetical protein